MCDMRQRFVVLAMLVCCSLAVQAGNAADSAAQNSAAKNSTAQAGATRTLARSGDGFLEEIDGYRVLHLKGEPYEMG